MKAILLDPQTKSMSVIEHSGDWRDISKLIGNDCTTFECPITLDNGDTFYCDEEGLYHENIGAVMERHGNWKFPITGRILILGTNLNTGKSVDVKSTPEEISRDYGFIPKETPALIDWIESFR